MTLFDVEDVPSKPEKIAANARRCAVCNRGRPSGGLPGEISLTLSGGERAWICSPEHRDIYVAPWTVAPWRTGMYAEHVSRGNLETS